MQNARLKNNLPKNEAMKKYNAFADAFLPEIRISGVDLWKAYTENNITAKKIKIIQKLKFPRNYFFLFTT